MTTPFSVPSVSVRYAQDGTSTEADEPDEEEVLAELSGEVAGTSDLARLTHVRSREEIRAAEEVARRNPCTDFDTFRPVM